MNEARALARGEDEKLDLWSSIPFFAAHAVAIVAPFFLPFSWKLVALAVLLYYARMAGTTIGYHRYASHRGFKTGRIFQFVLAFWAQTSAQKGMLWWAAHHRNHHKYSDQPEDVHSPQRGFWWSHVGWILCDKYSATDTDAIKDFARYPELRFLDKHDWIPMWALGVTCFLIGGWSGLIIGFFLSNVLLWHSTFTVNSLAHVFGRRRYDTVDTSRNNIFVALLTGGEGWHNNHHHYQSSARQVFFWWEIDVVYYVLKLLAAVGIARDLRQPPARVRDPRPPEPPNDRTEEREPVAV